MISQEGAFVQFVLHTVMWFRTIYCTVTKGAARLTSVNLTECINVYMSIMQCVCVFYILVQLLSSLNRLSLLLFRLIQRHRLCPARRLSGRSETHGSPL